MLEAEREEDRPQDVGQLRGNEQHRERHARNDALGGESEREMSDEHGSMVRLKPDTTH